MKWSDLPSTVEVDIAGLFELAESIGSPRFDRQFLNSIQRIADLDDAIGLVVPPTGTPYAVGWCGNRADVNTHAVRVARQFEVGAIKTPPADAAATMFHMGVLRPRDTYDHDGRHLLFSQGEYMLMLLTARRTAYGWAVTAMRSRHALDRSVLVHVAQQVSVLGAFAYRHIFSQGDESAFVPRPTGRSRLMEAMNERFPSLTTREKQILVATLCGQTASDIAREMEIGVPTVMTYRQRAYKRLGISHAGDVLLDLV